MLVITFRPEGVGGPSHYCPDCLQEQSEEEERQRAELEAIECKLRAQRRMERRFNSIRIGSRHAQMTFDDYQPPCNDAAEVVRQCRLFAENFAKVREIGSNLIMLGNPGTGKNMLSAAICREVVARDYSALHTTAAKMVQSLTATWNDRSLDERAILAEFSVPDLLVIDEVGAGAPRDVDIRYLTAIINDRYESRRSTIVISNLDAAGVERSVGCRAFDRLLQDSMVLQFTWSSWRSRC